MTISPMGDYTVDTGTYLMRFRCDGKPYPTAGQNTMTCTGVTANTMDIAYTHNGKSTGTTHRELSPDSKTLITTANITHPDGTKETKQTTFVRANRSNGFAGSWRDLYGWDREPRVVVTTLKGSVLRVAFPERKQYTDMKLDGTDAPIQGVSADAHATLSARPQGPLQMSTVKKVEGRVVNDGFLTISTDGQTLTQEWWRPEYPGTRGRRVYDRQ